MMWIDKNVDESAKKRLNKRISRRMASAGILAVVMGSSLPMTAMAASPEFARTAEEWAKLRDDVLEYDEIAGFIHEYNVTVQNNQYEYNEFIKDYGRTREDVAKAYRDLADDLEADKSGESEAMSRISDLQLEQQAKQLREQADDNIEDSHIHYLSYQQAEDNLAMSAQSKYISYFRDKLELESAKEEKQTLENNYQLAVTRRQAGTGTEMDVLDAQEKILEQEKTISKLAQEIEYSRQSLLIMLGWQAGDNPEICELPQFDLAELDGIDLEADKQTAIEQNYTLQINKRKLENARDADNQEKIKKTIRDNESQIAVSVTNAWNALQSARLSYEQAVADVSTQERSLSLSQQKWNVGMITRYEYEQQQITLSTKQRAQETAILSLLEALETYRWNVNGLASTG